MVARYHHTQSGTMILVVLMSASILSVWAGYLNSLLPVRWLLISFAIGLAVVGWLFSSLTIEVTEHEFRWYFGPGIWKYWIALAEIENIQIVHNKWWNGFGIRIRPGFRIYNVSGSTAIELRLRNGDIRRIGTDDVQGLSAALDLTFPN
jgi:hypothetical protein